MASIEFSTSYGPAHFNQKPACGENPSVIEALEVE